MICLFLLFSIVSCNLNNDFHWVWKWNFTEFFSLAADTNTMRSNLMSAHWSVVDSVHAGASRVYERVFGRSCPTETKKLEPLIEVTDGEQAIGLLNDNLTCVVETIQVTVSIQKVFGSRLRVYRGDIYGRAEPDGRLYLVHTDDLHYFGDGETDALELLEHKFPLGSTALCLPEFMRIKK